MIGNSRTSFSLRKLIVGQDEVPLYEALKDPAVVKHMASTGITAHDCKAIVSEAVEHWENHQIGSWAVCINKQIVGWAGFKSIGESKSNRQYEILIVLSPQFWGLGRDIFNELTLLAKTKFKLNEIYMLLPDTRGSYRFVERLGFISIDSVLYNGQPFRRFVLTLI